MILAHLAAKYGEEVECYFGVGFFVGPRVSEHIELQWPDVDWRRGILRVQRAKVRKHTKETKTGRARNHELGSRARGYLERMRKHTQLKSPYVFLDPITGNQHLDDQTPRRRYWEPTLKALGIRWREPKQMRHTYATTAIMAGANPNWVAKQMGNSPRIMYKHYARWIEATAREQQKVEAYIEDDSGRTAGLRRAETRGRRPLDFVKNRQKARGKSRGKRAVFGGIEECHIGAKWLFVGLLYGFESRSLRHLYKYITEI